MRIDAIKTGIVIDHIPAGAGMKLYELLGLDKIEAPVALIKNAVSSKMGKKDILKVDAEIELNLDVVGFIAPDATINVIKDGVLADKKTLALPEKLVNVIKCTNPRCVSGSEQEIDHVFRLADRENKIYRCIYCEAKGKIPTED